jgi:hypothetical protein
MRKFAPASAGLPAKKIALLHVAKKQLGLADADYRAILSDYGGVESAADLDEPGFQCVMNYLTALGFRSSWTKRTYGDRPKMATPAQVDLIRKLWAAWRDAAGLGKDERDAALNAWLAKYHKVSALRFVSREKAQPVIAALKAMVTRK